MIPTYNIEGLVYDFVSFGLGIPIGTYILIKIARAFKLKDSSVKTAFKIVFISNMPFFVLSPIINAPLGDFLIFLIIGFNLMLYVTLLFLLIKKSYQVDIKKTVKVWVAFIITDFLFAMVLELVLFMIATSLGFDAENIT